MPPEFGGISVVCDCAEKLFPSSLLFVLDIIRYFFVQCLYSVDDIRCGELVSEVVPCADFVSDVSIESGAIMFNSPGRDMLFTVVYDDGGEVFSGCVYVSEVVYVEVCESSVDVVGEVVPVRSVVVSVCSFRGGVEGAVKCVCNEEG